jgi:hypothetical protein
MRILVHVATLTLVMLSSSLTLFAQDRAARPIVVSRERTLARDGQFDSDPNRREFRLFPLERNVGIAFTQPVSRNGATGLRFHFRIQRQAAEPTWAVRIRDGRNTLVWTYSGVENTTDDDFWSDEIPGNRATIEVFSVDPDSNLELVAEVLPLHPAIREQAITEPNNLERYRGKPEPIRTWGRPVARVRFVDSSDGKQYSCTGFMITPDLLMTNEHCVNTEAERKSALIDFNFDGGNPPKTLRAKAVEAVDAGRDYSILRLAKRPDVGVLALKTAGVPSKAVSPSDGTPQALLIIQHPAGRTKEVSIIQCHVVEKSAAGVTDEKTDFEHLCDTETGSSGSPVLDPSLDGVVGLHHLGFFPDDKTLVNRAVGIDEVLNHLKSKNEALWKEITGAK